MLAADLEERLCNPLQGADACRVYEEREDVLGRAAALLSRATASCILGARGFGDTSRAGGWGSLPREEYLRGGNDEVALVLQIESPSAIDRLDEIGAVPGYDALFLGPADLAVSAASLPETQASRPCRRGSARRPARPAG